METTYTRKCPKCDGEIHHKSKYSRNQSEKGNKICQSCSAKSRISRFGNNKGFLRWAQKGFGAGNNNPFYGKRHSVESKKMMSENANRDFLQTPEYKQKVSENTRGEKNPMYGVSVYERWIAKYGQDRADELRGQWIEKQRANSIGKNNPMYGKPSPQGSGNGWSGWYNGVFFRSLKELTYMVGLDKDGMKWEPAANIKIGYLNWDGAERTYQPDFLVNDKYLVEIKPTRLRSSKIVKLKQAAAELYCDKAGLTYCMIDPIVLSDYEIKLLRSSGAVIFTDRYEQKFLERYNK
jgi:hypothetical protein